MNQYCICIVLFLHCIVLRAIDSDTRMIILLADGSEISHESPHANWNVLVA